jgi:hypothetical protein
MTNAQRVVVLCAGFALLTLSAAVAGAFVTGWAR